MARITTIQFCGWWTGLQGEGLWSKKEGCWNLLHPFASFPVGTSLSSTTLSRLGFDMESLHCKDLKVGMEYLVSIK